MRVAVTGTPGTGKTSATELVDTELEVVHLNDLIREEGLHQGEDPERESLYADMEALAERIPADCLVESHLAHNFDADRVVVLRCHPETLAERLYERNGESAAAESAAPELDREARENDESAEPPRDLAREARENAESEALDVILSEAVQRHGADAVYEIETTEKSPAEVAEEIEAVIAGEREPSAGTVNYTDWL